MSRGHSWRRRKSAPRVSVCNLLKLILVRRNISLFSCSVLWKVVADETAGEGGPPSAYSSAQRDYEDLEGAAVVACQELKGEGGSSGSSLASRLSSLGGRVTERLKGALRLSVQKALGIVSTHYIINLE